MRNEQEHNQCCDDRYFWNVQEGGKNTNVVQKSIKKKKKKKRGFGDRRWIRRGRFGLSNCLSVKCRKICFIVYISPVVVVHYYARLIFSRSHRHHRGIRENLVISSDTRFPGSLHNDPFYSSKRRLGTQLHGLPFLGTTSWSLKDVRTIERKIPKIFPSNLASVNGPLEFYLECLRFTMKGLHALWKWRDPRILPKNWKSWNPLSLVNMPFHRAIFHFQRFVGNYTKDKKISPIPQI